MSALKPNLCQHSCTCEIIRQDAVVCKLNGARARVQALASSYPFGLIVLMRWTGQRLFSLVSADKDALYSVPGHSPLGWPPSLVRLSTLCLLSLWLCGHKITAKKLIYHSKKVCNSPKGCWCCRCCLVPTFLTQDLPSSHRSPATSEFRLILCSFIHVYWSHKSHCLIRFMLSYLLL